MEYQTGKADGREQEERVYLSRAERTTMQTGRDELAFYEGNCENPIEI